MPSCSVKAWSLLIAMSGHTRSFHAPRSVKIARVAIAGFARGSADVVMEEDGGETVLHYRGGAELGGKIAQFGARLLESSARRLADRFFSKFGAAVVEKAEAPGGDRGLG